MEKLSVMSPDIRAEFAMVEAHSHGLSSPQLQREYVNWWPVEFRALDITAYLCSEIFGVPLFPSL